MLSNNKNYEGLVFSDDDDEQDIDAVKEQVSLRLQENTDNVFRAFKDFLSTPEYINPKGSETTNIVDMYTRKCYHMPDKKIPKYFKFLEICRRKKLKCMMYEKQGQYSGIMLDFDFKLNVGGNAPINHIHYHRLCVGVFKILIKYLHFTPEDIQHSHTCHVGFTKKPKIIYDNEHDYYKYGIHMLIPSIQITREFKKLIIDTIINDELLEKIFKDITPHSKSTRNEFIDRNSAHVGTFFIGSASKINTPPYELDAVYKISLTANIDSDDIIPVKVPEFLESAQNYNICYEFSLNWDKSSDKGGIILKKKFDIKAEHAVLLNQYSGAASQLPEDDPDDDANYNDMSILNIHDADISYIKTLLDILHPKRSEDYTMWMEVLCALAHTSPSYKPLGEYFSRKVPDKFDLVAFEKTWDSILAKKANKLSLGSLHYWAKLDNPDRYEEVKHRSIFNLLYKKIYDPAVEGYLEHSDVAEILYIVLKDKYVFDKYSEGGTWYEFILESEPKRIGEAFKWRSHGTKTPNTLLKYISKVLPILFDKILVRIKSTMNDAATDLAKYHYGIYKNFQKSCRSLRNYSFKSCVGRESEQLFEQIGFTQSLDMNPDLKGVANGVLQLGKKCRLITGYHGYLVSKYTQVRYKEFNPYDPITAKVIAALRNLFPDDEPDTFNYIMHYLASTLDGHKKESIFMILVGKGSNGKSFLVELHKGAIGEIYGVKMPLSFLTSRANDAETATPALMQLKDAHFAYYSESNKFEVLNMAKIKEFTGQETLGGRKLHQDYINFKPKCHHLVASNNDFEILGTDHGTWRRIDYVNMKIKFCSLPNDDFDEKNPYEREADPSLGSSWTENEEVLASYLGILAYYYESLQTHYGGKVRNVPHPHIQKETENFRNRQDRVNNFLNRYLVKTSNADAEMSMEIAKERYIKWHESQYPGTNKEYQRYAIDQLENSKIQAYIKKTNRGNFIKGYRILDLSEEADDDELYYNTIEKKEQSSNGIKPESAGEMLSRMKRDFDKARCKESTPAEPRIINILGNSKHDDDTDSDIEDMVRQTKRREPNKAATRKIENVDLSRLDANGINVPMNIHTAKKSAADKSPTVKNVEAKELNERKLYAKMGHHSSSEEEEENDDEDDSNGDDVSDDE